MPSKRLHRNQKFLEYYLEADKQRRRSLVLGAKKDQIDCLCEAALNIVNTNIPVAQSVKHQLCKHKKHLHKIIDKKHPIKNKKKLLAQHGAGFLPLILTTLLPLLTNALFPKSQ